MKKIILSLSVVLLVGILIFALATKKEESEYLRIHIRANSNSSVDQEVKYKVRDKVVVALIPILSEVDTFEDAKKVVVQNFDLIEEVANTVLKEEGFDYMCSARLCEEEFPTRVYGDLTLESGIYDALILDLGSGEGNNWWCLVYPAFCFTKSKDSTNLEYISKILEILEKVKG